MKQEEIERHLLEHSKFSKENIDSSKKRADFEIWYKKDLLDRFTKGVKSILDVGCAGGWLFPELIKRFETVRGCEPLKETAHPAADICYAEKMPYDDNTFDCVVANHVMEHCHDIDKAFLEISRVLVSGGDFIYVVPPLPSDQARVPGHITVLTCEEWVAKTMEYFCNINYETRKNDYADIELVVEVKKC